MLSTHFNPDEIMAAINQLKISGGKKYNVDLVRSEFQKPIQFIKGKWSPEEKIKNRQVLLIASGPKANAYKEEIENYIKLKKPYVMALNTTVNIDRKLIDVFVACNPLKLIADTNLYIP